MWEKLGHDKTIAYEAWPTYDESKLVKNEIPIAISVNGKTRDVLDLPVDIDQDGALEAAKNSEKVAPWLEGKTIRKVIFVKGRILNIVAN